MNPSNTLAFTARGLLSAARAALRIAQSAALVGLLGLGAFAQRCELLIEVDCSNLGPGIRGQGVIDQPRRVEIDVEITDSQGGVTNKTIDATMFRGGTARLAADLLAGQVNGQGSTPGQQSEVTSTDPSNPDWVDREDEVNLKLPDGVKVKEIRVYKRQGREWVTKPDGCVGHLNVSQRVKTSTGGVGRIGLLRDQSEPFGLRWEITGSSASGDEVFIGFRQGYPAGTSTVVALSELGQLLSDAGFEVEVSDDNLWILSSPIREAAEVVYGVWHNDPPFESDDPEGPEHEGELGPWSPLEIEFEAL